MLKDIHGKELEVGDRVLIPAFVKQLYQNGSEGGHVKVELEHLFFEGAPKSQMVLYSKQVLKVEEVEVQKEA